MDKNYKKCNKKLKRIGKQYRCENCDIFCPKCGGLVKESDKHCPHCNVTFDEPSKPLSKINKIILTIIGSIIILAIFGFIVKTTLFTCPSSCNDEIKCSNDFCSSETKYKCVHKDITPCVGNNKCEQSEYGTVDCPTCDDYDVCTTDSLDYNTLKCVNTNITPCIGNKICEDGEYGTTDCPSCDDKDKCTKDYIIYETKFCRHDNINCDDNIECTTDSCSTSSGCIHSMRLDCIGNNICEKNESDDSIDCKGLYNVKFGEEVKSGDLVWIIDSKYTTDEIGPNRWNPIYPNGIFLELYVSVRNDGLYPIYISNQNTLIKLKDINGRYFVIDSDATNFVNDYETFNYKTINPGVTVSKMMVFDVPIDMLRFVVEVSDSTVTTRYKSILIKI